jgi:hypothetical protein
MRRSICVTEPNYALAGERGTWKFTYTTATTLPKGARLRFDVQSKGRPIDWEIPQVNPKVKSNLIWAEVTSSGKQLTATALTNPHGSFEFTLPAEMKTGESLSILIGSPEKDSEKKGNACQKITQRRRPFGLWIDPKGKGDYKESELFALDIRGNALKNLRVVAPSLVARNKRFDVIVRFEDVHGNLTANAPEGTLIDLSYEHLRENLNWKLFVPETGFIALPNLYFNEAGLYRIQLKNVQTTETFYSSPIKCLPESQLNIYWGVLHGESDRIDSSDGVEAYLRHMRDERALQFVATSYFDSEEETSNDVWKSVIQQVAEFNEDDRFVAILGFQWLGDSGTEGLRQFLYTKDSKPILRRKDTKHNSLKKIYKTNNPKDILAMPSFTMGKTTVYDFKDFNPEYERVAEIYNAWGSSECTLKEGNSCPIQVDGHGKKGINESAEGSFIRALNAGCRFGFVAGGNDDRGPYSELFETEQVQYPAGITAILSKDHTRAAFLDALHRRSCYATTGEKIIVSLAVAQFGIGSEIESKTRPGLEYNRHITGYAVGTKPLSEAVLIRNGKEWRFLEIKDNKAEFEIDDQELLSEIALTPDIEGPAGEGLLPFAYYYLRVTQVDGHKAWSSPIWVLLNPKSENIPLPKKTKKK